MNHVQCGWLKLVSKMQRGKTKYFWGLHEVAWDGMFVIFLSFPSEIYYWCWRSPALCSNSSSVLVEMVLERRTSTHKPRVYFHMHRKPDHAPQETVCGGYSRVSRSRGNFCFYRDKSIKAKVPQFQQIFYSDCTELLIANWLETELETQLSFARKNSDIIILTQRTAF